MEKILCSVYLTLKEYQDLRELSLLKGVPKDDILHEAIRDMLMKHTQSSQKEK